MNWNRYEEDSIHLLEITFKAVICCIGYPNQIIPWLEQIQLNQFKTSINLNLAKCSIATHCYEDRSISNNLK